MGKNGRHTPAGDTCLWLKDVRGFRGEHRIPIRPITLFVGENSSGKTTAMAMLYTAVGISCVGAFCGTTLEASDLRAGALAAEGRSFARNVRLIELGYEHFVDKLLAVGAGVQRTEVPAAQETVADFQVDVQA